MDMAGHIWACNGRFIISINFPHFISLLPGRQPLPVRQCGQCGGANPFRRHGKKYNDGPYLVYIGSSNCRYYLYTYISIHNSQPLQVRCLSTHFSPPSFGKHRWPLRWLKCVTQPPRMPERPESSCGRNHQLIAGLPHDL